MLGAARRTQATQPSVALSRVHAGAPSSRTGKQCPRSVLPRLPPFPSSQAQLPSRPHTTAHCHNHQRLAVAASPHNGDGAGCVHSCGAAQRSRVVTPQDRKGVCGGGHADVRDGSHLLLRHLQRKPPWSRARRGLITARSCCVRQKSASRAEASGLRVWVAWLRCFFCLAHSMRVLSRALSTFGSRPGRC